MDFLNVPEKLFLVAQPPAIRHPGEVTAFSGHPCPEIADSF